MHEDGSLSDISGMGNGDEDGTGGNIDGKGKNKVYPGGMSNSFDNLAGKGGKAGKTGRGGAGGHGDDDADNEAGINGSRSGSKYGSNGANDGARTAEEDIDAWKGLSREE